MNPFHHQTIIKVSGIQFLVVRCMDLQQLEKYYWMVKTYADGWCVADYKFDTLKDARQHMLKSINISA